MESNTSSKRSYGVYALAAVIVVVIALVIWRANVAPVVAPVVSTGNPSQAVDTGAQATPGTGTVAPTGGKPAPVSSSLIGTKVSTSIPTLLPAYYAQELASTTLQVHLVNPLSTSQVVSPLSVTGEARGTWFFEATFPVYLTDENGYVLAVGQAIAQRDWMTTDFVPFSAALNFSRQKSGSRGFLILKKDNPSGLAKNDAAVEIVVNFQ